MSCKIIAIANQKGGVGKTTTAINFSASLAVAEKRVLLIDIDPQGNSTSGLGFDKDKQFITTYDILINQTRPADVIQKTEVNRLDLIPSNINLIGAELELIDVKDREFVLKRALESVKANYEYIVVDCPPSLGLLTINTLNASDSVLIPVQCEYYAMEGLGQLLNTIKLVRQSFNPNLKVEGILLTMFDSRNNLCHQVVKEINEHFSKEVFSSIIPRNIALSEAPSFGKPVVLYNIASKGAQSYLQLAKEVMERCSRERH